MEFYLVVCSGPLQYLKILCCMRLLKLYGLGSDNKQTAFSSSFLEFYNKLLPRHNNNLIKIYT